jgi:hypothetical protein
MPEGATLEGDMVGHCSRKSQNAMPDPIAMRVRSGVRGLPRPATDIPLRLDQFLAEIQ